MFHKFRTKELTEGQFAFLLNIPAGVLISFILLFPLVSSFSLSLHKVGLSELRTGAMAFVGPKNFMSCLSDPFFWTSLKNTFIFSGVSLSLMLSAGLI
ncbi:sugar ABC transporter permease, partial [Candidatus Aerophobetes bacterium]|nr:sugar ABC transporter permease [Candidatus Aerophobetes bacterium]